MCVQSCSIINLYSVDLQSKWNYLSVYGSVCETHVYSNALLASKKKMEQICYLCTVSVSFNCQGLLVQLEYTVARKKRLFYVYNFPIRIGKTPLSS